MDAKVKKCCPSCGQRFSIKPLQNQAKIRTPLVLKCGHSICEVCIRNILKFAEPIQCKICEKETELTSADKILLGTNILSVFPINIYLVGDIFVDMMQESHEVPPCDKYFIDLKQIINSLEDNQGACVECRRPTNKQCQQCNLALCEFCFGKTHKFQMFKGHVLSNIEPTVEASYCKTHPGKVLEYFCKDCSKSKCMDCMIVGGSNSCKTHNVVPIQEVNEGVIEELNDIGPKVDEVYRRLTKSAVDVAHLLKNIDVGTSTTEIDRILNNIQNHFSKLHSTIQKHENEIMTIITNLKSREQVSLKEARSEIESSIIKSKQILKKIDLVVGSENRAKMNLSALLEEAKEIVDTPWLLTRGEKKNELKIVVNEDLCALVSDYVHLEGNGDPSYKLKATTEIAEDEDVPPAPTKPVFPPELTKDVRESRPPQPPVHHRPPPQPAHHRPGGAHFSSVPMFRNKSGSTSSLNSVGSDSTYKPSSNYSGHYTPVVQPVSPFAESNQPQPLRDGLQELIFVTHIIAPNHFYVQRACHQSLVKQIQREFRNAAGFPKPTVHVAEGKVYLVFNKADNEWQRCRVISIDRTRIDNPLYHVFCIDFGSTEVVHGDKLRLVPHARLQFPPPLAINCSLANCDPKGGSWTTEDSILMQKIIDNKQAFIFIRQVLSESNYCVKLVCDVTTHEQGVSLAHALVFQERAVMPHPRLQYPRMMGVASKPKLFLNNNDYKLNYSEEVVITHVVSPDKFYVRKCHYQDTFEQLCDELDVEYSLSITKGTIYCPIVGMACVVNVDKYCEEEEGGGTRGSGAGGGWRRALVTETPGRRRARVWLPDSGVSLLVHYTQLRTAPEHVFKLKALATECHLSGVTPLNKKWNLSAVTLMQQYLMRPLALHVEEAARCGSVGVALYDHTDPDNEICLNTLMIKHKFAVTIGLFKFNKDQNEEMVYTNKNPLQKPKPAKKREPQIKILQRDEILKSPSKNVKDDDLEAKDKGPIKLEVRVLSCQSPSLVYVTLIDQQKTFKELFDKIQEYYNNNKTSPKTDWIVGDKCCTVSNESKTWRRAVIVELNEDTAKVFFSDFATVESVPVASLRELTPKFSGIGDAAIKCHLSGVLPADGEQWPCITKEYFKEMVDVYQRFFITKNGVIKDKSLPVELWVYHVIQGEALEPNKAEWRCLNMRIIEQGLGVPDKTELTGQASSTDKKGDSGADDMISFLGMSGSVHEWLQLEPPAPTKQSPDSRGSTPTNEDDDPGTNSSDSRNLLVSDWLPPEPLSSTEFTAMPTYIDNDGVIYLHDILQRDTLALIRNALEVRFKYNDPKARNTKWRVGQPCIARFYLDSCFYRGRVLEVNEETSKCIIHYIDYGNEEACSFEDMRNTIVLYEIPTQAHKCCLGRIQPAKERWDKTSLDYVHKLIVEKDCYVKIVGAQKGDVTPIDLKIDKLWLNDHLVSFDMARYDDGSSAVKAKYKHQKTPIAESIESGPSPSPDFIVEDEEHDSADTRSTDTLNIKYTDTANIDWNKIVEEEGEKDDVLNGSFITYPDISLKDNFLCNVAFINHDMLELSLVHNTDEVKNEYVEMYEKLQETGTTGAPLDGVYENKAVAAIFSEDQRWYRASIIEYSKAEGLVKVRYVDFGNEEVIPLSAVREIRSEWAELPPVCVSAQLHGVQINPDTELDVLAEFDDTFVKGGPFLATIVKRDNPFVIVKLLNEDGSLAYGHLIKNGVFLEEKEPSRMDECD